VKESCGGEVVEMSESESELDLALNVLEASN
jgi:hypothetical protein